MDNVDQVIAKARQQADLHRIQMQRWTDLIEQLRELNRVLENAQTILEAHARFYNGDPNGHTPRG